MIVKRKDAEFRVSTGQIDDDVSFWERINSGV